MGQTLSRTAGYDRSRGKEAAAVARAQQLVRDLTGLTATRIEDRSDNYRRGDLRVPSGATIECKRQPIDPGRYPRNFVEVFETTGNPGHADGFGRVATLLGMTPAYLAAVPVLAAGRRAPLGALPLVSVSIAALTSSVLTLYVNPGPPTVHVYAYASGHLLALVAAAVRDGRLTRGQGNANRDTHAVLVPLAPCRWTWGPDDRGWRYTGDGDSALAVAGLRQRLG